MLQHIKNRAHNFIEIVVYNEPWFQKIDVENDWDLFVLAGSHVRGDASDESDVDLFLVMPLEAQTRHNIPAVHEYHFEGTQFEISKTSSEKLAQSVIDKRNLFWWHKTHIIKSNNQKSNALLIQASELTTEDLKSLLWNNYCLFEIVRTGNIVAAVGRSDILGFKLCLHECVSYVVDSSLAKEHIFVSSKKRGEYLRRVNPVLYNLLSELLLEHNSTDIQVNLKELRDILVHDLLALGFTEDELEHWHQHHINRFLHQAH